MGEGMLYMLAAWTRNSRQGQGLYPYTLKYMGIALGKAHRRTTSYVLYAPSWWHRQGVLQRAQKRDAAPCRHDSSHRFVAIFPLLAQSAFRRSAGG